MIRAPGRAVRYIFFDVFFEFYEIIKKTSKKDVTAIPDAIFNLSMILVIFLSLQIVCYQGVMM